MTDIAGSCLLLVSFTLWVDLFEFPTVRVSMNVLLVSANREVITMPTLPVGLACIAAAAIRAGHGVSVLDLLSVADLRAAVGDAVRRARPEVIGIAVRNIDDQTMEPCRFLLEDARQVVRAC